jgi:hypothetical protein
MATNFIFHLNSCGFCPYVTSSLMRGWVCCLKLLMVLASVGILRSKSHGTHDHILFFQIQDSPILEGQVPVFISPRNSVAWLYPQVLGSLPVTSYDSQGYGGGIRPHLHMGVSLSCKHTLTIQPRVRPHGKQVHCPAKDVLLLPRLLKQKGVYRALHSNKHSTEPQITLLLLLCVCWNVHTESFPSKEKMSQYVLMKSYLPG